MGTLEEPPDNAPAPPPPISSSVSDEVILSFVDSLTEVMFHLPFSLSLCLAFGQTPSTHTTRSNPYVCGMCGLAGPVPQSQEGSASSSLRAPHSCQLLCVPLAIDTGSHGHFCPDRCIHILPAHQEGAVF